MAEFEGIQELVAEIDVFSDALNNDVITIVHYFCRLSFAN
jgi:hypothetical protein